MDNQELTLLLFVSTDNIKTTNMNLLFKVHVSERNYHKFNFILNYKNAFKILNNMTF